MMGVSLCVMIERSPLLLLLLLTVSPARCSLMDWTMGCSNSGLSHRVVHEGVKAEEVLQGVLVSWGWGSWALIKLIHHGDVLRCLELITWWGRWDMLVLSHRDMSRGLILVCWWGRSSSKVGLG